MGNLVELLFRRSGVLASSIEQLGQVGNDRGAPMLDGCRFTEPVKQNSEIAR